ncbi:MAG: YbaN family protein [Pseudomonadota bacterium]
MVILRLLGGLFLALGAIGLFLPIWPTTIFWILAAICFARSSPTTRDWIYSRPGVGSVVEDFVEFGRISRKSKVGALFGIGFASAICTALLWQKTIALSATLVTLALVATYVATRRET